MSLDNETGLDPPGIRLRPVSGLVAADYFAPGYFVWAVLIANLARIGYEENSMYMASYDWRLSFQNTEVPPNAFFLNCCPCLSSCLVAIDRLFCNLLIRFVTER